MPHLFIAFFAWHGFNQVKHILIITPRISWAPKESRQRIMDCAAKNLRAWIAGEPVNVVNP
jgi:lactate dehydrogenase-like 2-hydroxyacid dehydrogenase